MYREVDNSLNFLKREEEVLDFWKENDIFRKSVELRKDAERFTFYDGPPTANGKPHIGHVLTRVIKDIIPRYRTMKGYNVLRKAGWDTHGLPVELEVEKMLGIDGKDKIEAYGVEKFIEHCKESVWKYKKEWEEMSDRVGYWADMDDPYITYDNKYIESLWWALKTIWEKDLIYQGHKIVPYCPRCGTALASHEVAQGYHDVKEKSIYVRFKVTGEDDTYFAAWTTTPWTLPSNLALAVNADETYALVKVAGCDCEDHDHDDHVAYYYLAKDLIEDVFGEHAEIVREMKGRELEHKTYEPIFPYAVEIVEKSGKDAFYVTCADYVTLTDGTGIVHIAPAFGEDDAAVGKAYNLPFVQLVNDDGTMPAEVTDAAGEFCKDADAILIDKLADDGLLIRTQMFEHSYPFCWRCDTPLIYYARHSWFIEMTKVRDMLLANNAKVNWIPETIGTGRFGNFLENVVDWGLSRERYWGTPLPMWICDSCHKQHMIGSVAELREMAVESPEGELDLHKPYVDKIELTCPDCGGVMHRVPEVIDCWFDSGSMPFAQWHYPFENKEKFEARFPADFISEAVDQTRGWFYTMMAIATLLFDEEAFENCIVLGHVLDANGIKMSKHKGNVVDPWDMLNGEGADAVRWYFYTNSQPWLPSRFSGEAVNEMKRRYMGTVWNTYAFYVLYANIDNFNPAEHELDRDSLSIMDRWILSRLNTLIKNVDTRLGKYDITGAARALEAFADDLSNWYVRRGRERYWAAGMEQDKINAYMTLFTVLKSLTLLSAPFVPFMSENMYQNLIRTSFDDAPESVHLADYPVADESFIDANLEEEMKTVLQLVILGRSARNTGGMKIRQPLSRMIAVGADRLSDDLANLVLDELNIKQMEWADQADDLKDYRFKPQLRLLGRRFGKNLPELQQVLTDLNGQEAMRRLKEDGFITVNVAGQDEKLIEEELLIETVEPEGYATASDHGIFVALDTELTDELIEEGMLRELVSKIQTMRKESGYEVTDRINLYYGESKLSDLIENHADWIRDEVLAREIKPLTDCDNRKEWDINGVALTLAMEVNNQ